MVKLSGSSMRRRPKCGAPPSTARSAPKCNWELWCWIPSTGMAVLLLRSICNWYLSVLMARTQAKKETVQLNGAPSSKLKALQEINEEQSSLLPIHKASSSSSRSPCIKPQLHSSKAPHSTSKSLMKICALFCLFAPFRDPKLNFWSKGWDHP